MSRIGDRLVARSSILALLIVGLAIVLRLPGLAAHWPNPDEGIYFSMITLSDAAAFWERIAQNAHPPLYYLILRGVGWLTEDFGCLRMVALVWGAAAVFAAYLAGRDIAGAGPVGSLTGLLAALTLAVSPSSIVLSQLMRPYMLLLASLLFATWCLVRYLREPAIRWLLGYGACLSIALLTHYSAMLFLVAAVAVLGGHAIARRLGRRQCRDLLAVHAIPLLIVLGLYLLHIRPRLAGSSLERDALEGWLGAYMIDSPASAWRALHGSMALLVGGPLAAAALLLLLGGLALAVWQRRLLLAGLATAVLVVAMLAAGVGRYPLGFCRHATWTIGVLVLVPAFGLGWCLSAGLRWRIGAVLAVVLLGLASVGLGRTSGTPEVRIALREQLLEQEDMRALMESMSSLRQPGCLIMSGQCYYQLLPMLREQNEGGGRSHDRLVHFRFGARDGIVPWDAHGGVAEAWIIRVDVESYGLPGHLCSLVQRVDAELPALRLGEQRRVLMMFGGWATPTADFLRAVDERLPTEARLISGLREVPGLVAFEFDLAAYVRQMQLLAGRRR